MRFQPTLIASLQLHVIKACAVGMKVNEYMNTKVALLENELELCIRKLKHWR